MNNISVKPPLLLAGLLLITTSPLFSQANGPDAPLIGARTPGAAPIIIPEEVTFGYSTTPVSDFGNELEFLPELEYVSYGDFPDEVVITVYHTPW